MAAGFLPGDISGMEGLGARLRARAKELGLSDAEVARRAGLTAVRYGHYVTDYREPDLRTLLVICRVLGAAPADLLAYEVGSQEPAELIRRRIAGFAETMDLGTLETAATVVQALALASNQVPPAVPAATDTNASPPAKARRGGQGLRRDR